MTLIIRRPNRYRPGISNKSKHCPRTVSLSADSGPLRLVAFSDYRVQDIRLLLAELEKLNPKPDLILYGGDDVGRFREPPGENLFEKLAAISRYGLCAVVGNDDLPSSRNLIRGRGVFNAHLSPVIIGDHAVLGVDGAPRRRDLPGLGYLLHTEREIATHLGHQKRAVALRKLIVLSHTPPEGILDQARRFSVDGRPRSIGSRSLRKFLRVQKNVAVVVCGHVHRCGGTHRKVGRALVLNAANHDDYKAVGRFAVVELGQKGHVKVEWREIRETSVVPGIAEASAQRLRTTGIRTVEELAAAPFRVLRGVPHLGHSPEVLKARAEAIVQGKPILLRAPTLPPGPKLFLDIETDLRQEYVWLIGVVAGRDGEYKRFFAETPEKEKGILLQFLEFATQHADAKILSLSGSNFEQRVLSKRLAHHGLPTAVSARIIDLFWTLTPCVALPTRSYRVKEIGTYFGYKYKHPDLDGYTVASLYEGKYQNIMKTAVGVKLAQKLIEYNEDDVRCLPYILERIEQLPDEFQ